MLNFIQWCEKKSFDLPDMSENQTRTGLRFGYPDAYLRGQYPDGYFPATSASAFLDIQNSKKFKDKADVVNSNV